MTWFKVDDSFHSHPKVLAASPAALGLWVVAGSWAGSNLSDGFVPDHVLPRLLPDSATLAKELVACRLWRRVKGGYRFHDWGDFNPRSTDIQNERSAARERMRRLRAGRRDASVTSAISQLDQENGTERPVDNRGSRPGRPGHGPNGSGEQPANVRGKFVTPTRPDPTPISGGAMTATNDRAPAGSTAPRCEKHQDDPNPPPCGACGDARRAVELAAAESRQRQADAPKCRRHRGELAHNCRACRSEALAGDAA